MNKNKPWLSRFFSHDITLLVLAFLISFSAWFIINLNSEDETPRTINKVNINLELPESAENEGYEIFTANTDSGTSTDDESDGSALQASVSVKGSKVIIGSLSASDLSVTTSLSDAVITPGEYPATLTAKKNSLKTNYEIVSVTPSTITVYIDRRKDATFTIDNQITVQLNDADHYASTTLSQKNVSVTGPETILNKIKSAAVVDTVSGKDATLQEEIIYLDKEGNELDEKEVRYLTPNITSVEANVTVLPLKTVSLSIDVNNAPADYPEISIRPATVKIAGPEKSLKEIEDDNLVIGALDFTKLQNELIDEEYSLTAPTGCKVVSGETSAIVSVDLSAYESTTVSSKVVSSLDSDKYTTEFIASDVTVQIYGPDSLVSEITSSDITVSADFTGLLDNIASKKAVSLNVPLKITFSKDYAECWAYGDYTAEVKVTKK